jgi:hypothetical protein
MILAGGSADFRQVVVDDEIHAAAEKLGGHGKAPRWFGSADRELEAHNVELPRGKRFQLRQDFFVPDEAKRKLIFV